ncbi:HU family DNA-binding protein [Pseudomonas sp. NPDC098747]|uniref:HU family DNA-binding protein n=1 Tax=Pseudomonas sp. NPDC098747 TaxID=3364487 RepID=UPI00383B4E52
MLKPELIRTVATQADLSQSVSRAVVHAFIKAISASLASGQEVKLRGLGTFAVRYRAASIARNPRTGELFTIPANKRVYFKASKTFKSA